MKVITLERLKDFIESKVGKEQQIIFFRGSTSDDGVVVFLDNGCFVSIKSDTKVEDLETMNNVNCVINFKDIEDIHNQHPFIKSREAINGVIKVCGYVSSEEELSPYFFKL